MPIGEGMTSPGRKRSGRMGGFTYIGLLFAVALLGVALAAAGVLWHTEAVREKEAELLFIGQEFQRAIASYHSRVVNGGQQFPKQLEDLVDDKRLGIPLHHLRRIYRDPMTGSADWGLVRMGGGITAVYSQSLQAPLKVAGFAECCAGFVGSSTYAEWKFAYREPTDSRAALSASPVDLAAAPAAITDPLPSPSPVNAGNPPPGSVQDDGSGAGGQALADFQARLARYHAILAERQARIAAARAGAQK